MPEITALENRIKQLENNLTKEITPIERIYLNLDLHLQKNNLEYLKLMK